MKKLFLIILFILVVVGCSSKDNDLQQKYDYMVDLISKDTKYQKINNVDIDIFVSSISNNKYHYEIILSNPQTIFKDLKIIAMPINYDYKELLPNLNVIQDVDISSFNSKKTDIKLNYFSNKRYNKFKVLLTYVDGNNTVYLTNYYLVEKRK